MTFFSEFYGNVYRWRVRNEEMALLLSISLMSYVSAVTGTYVEVTPFNTVTVDGTEPWNSTDSVAGLWRQKGFGNESTIYQGQDVNGSDLKTTISDLIPVQVANSRPHQPPESWSQSRRR